MGLVGMIIATIFNLSLKSGSFSIILNYIGVLFFTLFAVYDSKNNYENKNKENNYYKKEIINKNYSRFFYIPKNINTEKLLANLEDGIFKIVLPRAEDAKSKKITIN